jgi:hypothetical protein
MPGPLPPLENLLANAINPIADAKKIGGITKNFHPSSEERRRDITKTTRHNTKRTHIVLMNIFMKYKQ